MFTRDTIVAVHPFTQQPEREDVIIGRIETGVFLAVPLEAVELLEQLAQGKTVGEVADIYHQKHGEPVDLDDFLTILETKGIVERARDGGGSKDDKGESREAVSRRSPAPPQRYHFSTFPQPLAQRLFGKPVLTGCFLVIAIALVLVGRDPSLIGGWRDLYFPDRRTLSWGILTMAGYAALFAHELAHLIAARATGINSRMGISNRLWYLVAETDLTGLWSVPKKQRYLPMLAGVLLDAVSGSLLVLLLFAYTCKWLALPTLCVRLVRAMAFTYLMRIVWQFCLFIRTDFYYVIASVFDCRNLLNDTKVFLRNQVSRLVPWVESTEQVGIPAAERRVIQVYSVLFVAGRLWALFLLLAVTIPLFVRYAGNLASAFRTGYSANPSNFVDAVLLATYFLLPTTIGFTLWVSGMVRRQRS
jgi:putative peptide zinc metalloprotease protein